MVSTPTARMPLTACARRSGEMTSDSTPTDVGGSVPAARPISTLRTRNTSMLGANADASTAATKISSPARITGRRPKESDSGPTVSKETAQAAKVAVASCPATGTEISRSVEISHQQRREHEHRVLRGEHAKRKHGKKPRLVDASLADWCRLRSDAARSPSRMMDSVSI